MKGAVNRRLDDTLLRIYVGFVVLFVFTPILSLALMSFHEGKVQSFPIQSYSAVWYAEAWSNPVIREGLWTSLKIGLIVAPISTALGFISAHVLVRHTPRHETLYIAVVSLPALVPLLLSGMALLMYFQEIRLFGSIWAIVAAHVCYCSPFALGFIRNSYQSLNPEVEQAARDLGARPRQVIFGIVVPQLWPALLSAMAISFLLSWDEFILAWFVGGFTQTLPTVIYGMLGRAYTPSINVVGLMAMLVSIGLLITALMLQQIWIRNQDRHE